MKINKLLLFFLLLSNTSFSQSQYELEYNSVKWNFTSTLFYLNDIVDDRNDKSSAGQVLVGDKSTKAKFQVSLETDIKNLLSNSLEHDNSKVPLLLSIDKFSLKETGNSAHHKLIFEYSLKIYRVINNKRYQLYEVSGKPELDMRGPYPNPYEKIIRESMRRAIESFNGWINNNPDLNLLVQNVVVVYVPETANPDFQTLDTIPWTDGHKLKWSDFKGKPDASSFMALSNCVFIYRADPVVKNRTLELHIDLHSGFDKNSSWVKKGQEKDTLLAHEQLHFDICELYMRQLRKKILATTFDMIEYGSQIGELFSKAWSDYQLEQQRYDDETGHGVVVERQQAWENDILQRLK